jgi:hypothetical protein
MADAFHIGVDDPQLTGGVLPVPDQPYASPPVAAPARPNPTDPDWSHFPAARSTSQGPDGAAPVAHPLSDFWTRHTGPQAAPKPDGTDITGSMAGVPETPPAPPAAPGSTAPDAAGLPTATPPEAPRALTADEQVQEWLHPSTPMGQQVKHDMDAVVSGFHAAWENDTLFGGLENATADAISNIVENAKAKLGVTLEDPMHNGYRDEAVQRVIARQKAQTWGQFFNPVDPESFFGGGTGFLNAVQDEQMKIFDEKRRALADKIQGDNAYDRAGANADALALIDPDTPAAQLGAKLSHQANVAAAQAVADAGDSWSAKIGNFVGGMAGGVRDPVNDLALMFGGGTEATLAKTYFPLASTAVRTASNIAEDRRVRAGAPVGERAARRGKRVVAGAARHRGRWDHGRRARGLYRRREGAARAARAKLESVDRRVHPAGAGRTTRRADDGSGPRVHGCGARVRAREGPAQGVNLCGHRAQPARQAAAARRWSAPGAARARPSARRRAGGVARRTSRAAGGAT